MKKIFYRAYLILLICFFSSCGMIAGWMYGIKDPKPVSEIEINEFSKSVSIAPDKIYFIDTLLVKNKLSELAIVNPASRKDFGQPLQVRVYGKDDTLISWLVNCYVPGFPKLHWNFNGTYSAFPPAVYLKTDSTLNFFTELNWIRSLNNVPVSNETIKKGEINIIVYCCLFMKKQSKNLIRELQNYKSRFPDKDISMIYVITDNLFVE